MVSEPVRTGFIDGVYRQLTNDRTEKNMVRWHIKLGDLAGFPGKPNQCYLANSPLNATQQINE